MVPNGVAGNDAVSTGADAGFDSQVSVSSVIGQRVSERSRRPALCSGLCYSVWGPPQRSSVQRSSPSSSVQVPPAQRSGRPALCKGLRYSVGGPSSNSVPTEFEFNNGGNDLVRGPSSNSVPTEFEFDNGGNDLANSVPTENDCKFASGVLLYLYCIVLYSVSSF